MTIETSESVLIGIDVKPCWTVSVLVTVKAIGLDTSEPTLLSVGVELVSVLSAMEVSPLTMLSEIVCAATVMLD